MRPFGTLRQIWSEGITAGDPTIVIMEVARLSGCPLPPVTKISGPEGLFTVQMALRSLPLPLPPQLMHIQRAMKAMDELGKSTGQTILKGTMEKEDERSQIARILEKRSTHRSHNKVRLSANKEEGGDMAVSQTTILKR